MARYLARPLGAHEARLGAGNIWLTFNSGRVAIGRFASRTTQHGMGYSDWGR
ncbi:hypothetical protein R7R25_24230 [Vibrio sp. 2026]|uniref:hypothetical protein n=1 Tax=unclassified Vibrio TaxID=2614977 RepID=UPI0029650C0C|nr:MULTISPECIES: hypothetical protein [unclassified Vibrio]MDW2121724.1 hypothetical protein [Vibrio sp. 2026]MDW2210289.1 hypothetical protein [Vibrio sp. 2025]